MKKSILCIIFFCISGANPFAAQNGFTDDRTNLSKRENFFEGGMKVYRLEFLGNTYLYSNYDKTIRWSNEFFRGLNFKYFFGRNAIRLGIDYFKKEERYTNWEYYNSQGIAKTGILNLGYQRVFRKARFSPYVFADFNFEYTSKKGMEASYNYYGGYLPAQYQIREYKNRVYLFGISPGLGLRYNPFKSIVLNLETNFQWYYLMFRDVKKERRPYNDSGFKLYPVQASLAFIF